FIGAYGSAILKVLYSYEDTSDELKIEGQYRQYSALISTVLTFILYFLINAAFITIIDPKTVANPNLANESIAIDFGIKLYGENGRKLISSLIVISSIGSLESMVLLSQISFNEFKNIPKIHNILFSEDTRNIKPYPEESKKVKDVENVKTSEKPEKHEEIIPDKSIETKEDYIPAAVYFFVFGVFILCTIFIAFTSLFPVPNSEYVIMKYPYFLPHLISLITIFVAGILKYYEII
ncbi:2008_t:CDS:2, partial [Scutellospora calospora]